VRFVGYRKPHPLENKIELKIQTTEESRPYDTLKKGVDDLKTITSKLRRSFEEQMKKMTSV
jgi:DNA-directed RNA polymerase II subunit RPB11